MEPTPSREQEQSIKERKQLLYDEEELPPSAPGDAILRKPFAQYLREVPAAPLSLQTRAILWALGVVIAVLLGGAILKSTRPKVKAESTREQSMTIPSFSIGRLA